MSRFFNSSVRMRRSLPVLLAAMALAGPVAPASAAETAVGMTASRYVPSIVTVAAGDTVKWTNNDAAGHSVTADDAAFDSSPSCGGVGGKCMIRGETFSMTFPAAGSFGYYCRVHGAPGQGMAGSVTVNG